MITPLILLPFLAFVLGERIESADAGCTNEDNVISCCAGFEEELWVFDLKLEACANIELDWDNGDINLELTVNGGVLFDTTFGINHAPELCAEFLGMDICIGFTDLELDDWEFSGCVSISVNDSEIDLGCWDINKDDSNDEEASVTA